MTDFLKTATAGSRLFAVGCWGVVQKLRGSLKIRELRYDFVGISNITV
jgi:hypothetical protein